MLSDFLYTHIIMMDISIVYPRVTGWCDTCASAPEKKCNTYLTTCSTYSNSIGQALYTLCIALGFFNLYCLGKTHILHSHALSCEIILTDELENLNGKHVTWLNDTIRFGDWTDCGLPYCSKMYGPIEHYNEALLRGEKLLYHVYIRQITSMD